ncbi:MAG: hypothetical protein RIF33_13655 [Cyclobacteriaceae bacterium]
MSVEQEEGKPPFFSTWRGLYIFVLIWLIVLIGLMYWFTISFR